MPSHQTRLGPVAILDVLRAEIGRAQLEPGAPLKQEQLAQRFGVSHVPVREALNQLVSQGLASTRRNSGTFVSALTAEQALELSEYRSLLESHLMLLATPNLSRADLAAAGALLDRLDKSRRVDEIVELNAAFHALLYAKAGRPLFMQFVDAARINLGRYIFLTWDEAGNHVRSQSEHRRLLAFCAAGKSEAAAKLTREHLMKTGELIAQIIRKRQDKT